MIYPSSLRIGKQLHFRVYALKQSAFLSWVAVAQSLSHVQLFATPWTAACQASLVHHYLPEFAQAHVHWVSDDIQPPHPLSPLSLFPSIFPSIRFFSSESVLCIKWLKYLCLSFSISPSNQYSGLSSFGIDWFDLLAAQGTLKSLRQHHSGLGWSMANSVTMWLSWRLVPSVCYKSKPFFYHNVHLIKKNKVLEPLESTFRRSQYFHTFKKVAGFWDPHICVQILTLLLTSCLTFNKSINEPCEPNLLYL